MTLIPPLLMSVASPNSKRVKQYSKKSGPLKGKGVVPLSKEALCNGPPPPGKEITEGGCDCGL